MDGVYSNPTIINIFKRLKVYESVEFIKPNEFFSIRTKWGEFSMPNGLSEAKGALIKKFPDERRGIEQYFKTIARVGKSLETLQNPLWYHYLFFPLLFWDILLYRKKSVTDVLRLITYLLTKNNNLQYNIK